MDTPADFVIPAVALPEPPGNDLGERASLTAWIVHHRQILAAKCSGLGRDLLAARTCPPSTLTLLGLLRHMTEVERYWALEILDGQGDLPALYRASGGRDDDFDDLDSAPLDRVWAAWLRSGVECDAAYARVEDLDGRRPRRDGHVDVRWVMTHLVEEYARHNGHADLLREAADGATGCDADD